MKGIRTTTHRELLQLARSPSLKWMRLFTVCIPIFILFAVLVISGQSLDNVSGKELLLIITMFSTVVAWFTGGLTVADSISSERREGTLGLLMMTQLNPAGIILGKWLSNSISYQLNILGMMPIFCLPLLAGGITIWNIVQAMVGIYICFTASSCIGILISANCRKSRESLLATLSVLLCFPLVFFLLAVMIPVQIENFPPLYLTPLFPSLLIEGHDLGIGIRYEGTWFTIPNLLASFLIWGMWIIICFFLLILANKRMVYLWNADLNPTKKLSPFREKLNSWLRWASDPVTKIKKSDLKKSVKEREVVEWIKEGENPITRMWKNQARLPAWQLIFHGLIEGIYIMLCVTGVWILTNNLFGSMENLIRNYYFLLAATIVLDLIFKLMGAYEVCRKLIDDRKSGGLELITTTSIPDLVIRDGLKNALMQLVMRYRVSSQISFSYIHIFLFCGMFYIMNRQNNFDLSYFIPDSSPFFFLLTFGLFSVFMCFFDWQHIVNIAISESLKSKGVGICALKLFIQTTLVPFLIGFLVFIGVILGLQSGRFSPLTFTFVMGNLPFLVICWGIWRLIYNGRHSRQASNKQLRFRELLHQSIAQ